jgi:integrase
VNSNWAITPEKYLNKVELASLLARAEELKVLGVAKRQAQPIRDWMIVQTFLFTGLRRFEVSALLCTDFRVFGGHSHVVVRRGKGGKERHVHLPAQYKRSVVWYLKWKAERGEIAGPDAHFIRSERSQRMAPSALYKRWKKHCPTHRLHDARHTHATNLYEATKSLKLVQVQLGHSSIAVSSVYAHVTPQQAIEGVAAMERLMRSPVRPPRPEAVAAPVLA